MDLTMGYLNRIRFLDTKNYQSGYYSQGEDKRWNVDLTMGYLDKIRFLVTKNNQSGHYIQGEVLSVSVHMNT